MESEIAAPNTLAALNDEAAGSDSTLTRQALLAEAGLTVDEARAFTVLVRDRSCRRCRWVALTAAVSTVGDTNNQEIKQ